MLLVLVPFMLCHILLLLLLSVVKLAVALFKSMMNFIMLSVSLLNAVILSVILLNVIIMSVIMLNLIIVSVVFVIFMLSLHVLY